MATQFYSDQIATVPRAVRVGAATVGLSDYHRIQSGIDYAASQSPAAGSEWVVEVYPGTYIEQITGAAFVRLVAMGTREQCIISQADADVVTGADNFSIEGFTIQVTAPTAARTLVNCGATSLTIRKCRFVGAAAQPITAVSHTTGSPVVEDCETGTNTAVLFYSNGAGTLTGRRITSTATAAILTSAACGAAFIDVTDSNFGSGTITTTAGGTPSISLTRVHGSGDITHACASSIIIANCNLTGNVTLSGDAFPVMDASHSALGAITQNGTGLSTFTMCSLGNIINNSTGTITLLRCSAGIIQQAAAAGTINLEDAITFQDLSTGAGGTIKLYGKCYFGSISANAGVITWQVENREWRVVASAANMRVADAIAAATAGVRSTISIGPGDFAESNLTMKNLVDLVGDDPENCQIVANAAGVPILTVPNGVTCTIEGIRVENTDNTAGSPAVRVTGGVVTIRNCYLKDQSTASGGTGALTLVTASSTVSVWDSTIEGMRFGVRGLNIPHTLYCRNVRFTSGTSAAVGCLETVAFVATLEHCNLGNYGVIVHTNGTANLKYCSDVGIAGRGYAGTYNLTGCSGVALSTTGGTVVCKSCVVTSISGGNSAATSITLDDACEISGAITSIHASATLILPRKRLGVGLGAPGLLANATQMDSVAGAGVPINQAPATRTTTDWPRTVKVVWTGANSAFPQTVTLTGTAMLKGALVTVTETITVTGAGTFRGVVPWHNISNWATSGSVTAGDTVALQFDSRLGLEHRLRDATHLLACRKSPGGAAPRYIAPASFTLDLTNYTIEETGVAVVAGDNYEFWVVKG